MVVAGTYSPDGSKSPSNFVAGTYISISEKIHDNIKIDSPLAGSKSLSCRETYTNMLICRAYDAMVETLNAMDISMDNCEITKDTNELGDWLNIHLRVLGEHDNEKLDEIIENFEDKFSFEEELFEYSCSNDVEPIQIDDVLTKGFTTPCGV